MDLRDLWLHNPFESPPTGAHEYLNKRLEAACIRRASRVVSVTPSMSEELRRRFCDQLDSKFLTLTNGFDPGDFDPDLMPDDARFTMRYIGSLYGIRSPTPFLHGLLAALRQCPMLGEDLRVEIIGNMDRWNRQIYEALTSRHGLRSVVSVSPFVPHRQAVALMQQAQVQLLMMARGEGMEGVYTSKLFEYLGARRPILAVAPPGVAASLIQESEAGIVAEPDSPEDIADAILTFYSWFRQGRLREWSPQGIESYDRRHLTGQLASLLDALVEQEHA
jgi:glycosyltransferase involved in cell wall biosynthesis